MTEGHPWSWQPLSEQFNSQSDVVDDISKEPPEDDIVVKGQDLSV